MKKIAFITSEIDPNLIRDDQLAVQPLKELGFEVEPLVWDLNPDVSRYDALVFRSCWNYHDKFEEFLKWLKNLGKTDKLIMNSVEISHWNLNKKYLLELQVKGAVIPKTEWIAKHTVLTESGINAYLTKMSVDKVVIKPAVSLNGYDTYLVNTSEKNKIYELVKHLLKEKDVLIQEYIPEIKTQGEVSLIYFNKKYSHSIRKLPKDGEFRIHAEYGGVHAAYHPSAAIIKQADQIVNMIKEPLLFCRVDIVEKDETAVLIELEIIDPMLFLSFSETAPRKFAEAIAEHFKTPR